MRLRTLAPLVGLAALLAVPAAATPRGGTLRPGSYTEPGGLTRSYLLYTPAHLPRRAPLVVFLHGCNETAREAVQATHWDALADRHRFAVLYPSQTIVTDGVAPVADGNGLGCWTGSCRRTRSAAVRSRPCWPAWRGPSPDSSGPTRSGSTSRASAPAPT